jgi:hypothetical protein
MNKREIGLTHQRDTLALLSSLGYATTRQIAKGVWDRCDLSTRKMASRLLRRFTTAGLVVVKRDGDNINSEQLAALTRKGADAATGMGYGLCNERVHARDWLRHAHSHRTACNSVYVALPAFGDIYSELEICSGVSPLKTYQFDVNRQSFTKIPDLVAINKIGIWDWIEVENSWRSSKDLEKVIVFMRSLFYRPSGVDSVHFVIAAPAAKHIGQRLRRAMTHPADFSVPRQIKELDARILEEHIRVSELDAETLTLTNVDF